MDRGMGNTSIFQPIFAFQPKSVNLNIQLYKIAGGKHFLAEKSHPWGNTPK